MRVYRTLLGIVLLASAAPTVLLGVLLARERGGLDAVAIAAIGASAGLAAALSGLAARRITRPISQCVRGALEIARGRFGHQVRVTARNEIGDLAYTFNHMSRELASYDAENRRLIAALERGYLETIRSLASAIDAKDPYTRGHAERVAALAVELGRELGLSGERLAALEYAGLLHDVGKIGIPDAILAKASPLTREEMALVQAHPRIGAEIVGGVAFLAGAVPAIRGHHERWDGDGYPDRLAGEAIPLAARIVSAADTWDACTSERPYQRALAPSEAARVVATLRGTQLDPTVHGALMAILRRRGILEPGASSAA
ncbi:HD-GYP domain-containing protein [Anaeromyxobacter oryzisoli]|uniref:HD-GYP domain-containing protein n=1 Tax=Anaeromyxobacter oryzisoli TaxID=2925408 RepID=UPI001F56544B|nr:HD domain-containing phosphohydrolase [Anaeromyxobacter sp. SG63]